MTDKTPAEILRAARALIEDPEHWCQGTYARNKNGAACGTDKGCRWCAYGALRKIYGPDRAYGFDRDDTTAARFLYKSAILMPGRQNVLGVNDGGTHKDVMVMYDRAIELAKADG